MRKRREAFTIPLLIGREAWTPSAPRRAKARRGAGAEEGAPKRAADDPPFPCSLPVCGFPSVRMSPFWFVPRPGVLHPFPSRTRPLRPPAAMILRSRARESSAARTFLHQARPRPPGRWPGLFCARLFRGFRPKNGPARDTGFSGPKMGRRGTPGFPAQKWAGTGPRVVRGFRIFRMPKAGLSRSPRAATAGTPGDTGEFCAR